LLTKTNSAMIKAGIIGAAGYTAGELIRILVNHPGVEIAWAQSSSNAGNKAYSVHQGLLGDTELEFCAEPDLASADVVFLCSGHGKSEAFWQEHDAPAGLRIIDLAQDFRDEHDGYVYGLPEWQKEKICKASRLANPGCFATCIQLALLPLAGEHLLEGEVTGTAITGSTGAGVKPGATTHFSWRCDNISAYKVFEHQHLIEINRNLALADGHVPGREYVNFVPLRGDFTRGIFATLSTLSTLSAENATELYREWYKDAPFTFVSGRPVDLKEVVNTNKCLLFIEKHGDRLAISSVIDNLLKGASGQAVQNMNLMFGLPETAGLKLKASAF